MKLGSLFSNGAVLQRSCRIPVWGTAAPQTLVRVTIASQSVYAISSADGNFLASLPPLEAGGPYELVAEDTKSGEKITVQDVLIGEVWLASGQSNMEYHLKESPEQFGEFQKELRKPGILRCFTVPHNAGGARESSCKGQWESALPEYTPEFSAVASWFALRLLDKLHIPVGIIHSSWGGTIAEAWTSSEMLRRNPDMAPYLESYWNKLSRPELWNVQNHTMEILFAEYADPGNEGEKSGWAKPDFDDCTWQSFNVPGSWIHRHAGGNGICWIRRKISLPADWSGKALTLELGGVDKTDVTYFNGTQVGSTGSGFATTVWNVPRKYKIPAAVNSAREAVIAIRAFSFAMDGSFNGKRTDYRLYPEGHPAKALDLSGEWKLCMECDFGIVSRSSKSGVPGLPNSPAILFDGMIRPLIPYAMRGVIWYQGESNAAMHEQYRKLLTDLIADWRFRWGLGDFPFLIVQLANYLEPEEHYAGSTWAPLRQAQLEVVQSVPHTGLAVTIDVGDASNIHPRDKRTVGDRLALLALQDVYGMKNITGHSPSPVKAVRQKDGSVTVQFRNVGSTLAFRGTPRGFWIAGEDGVFQAASVSSFGPDFVTLKCPVSKPQIIRYGWSDNPPAVLFGGSGLPATPFELKIQ